MKIRIIPTEDIEQLRENLEPRVKQIQQEEDELVVETEKESLISKTPGVRKYYISEEEKEGFKGQPISKKAYAKLNTKKDAVRALIATQKGFDLVVLQTERDWDYRQLKKYNPNIRRLKSKNPKDLGIKYALFDHPDYQKPEITVKDEDVEEIYRTMLT